MARNRALQAHQAQLSPKSLETRTQIMPAESARLSTINNNTKSLWPTLHKVANSIAGIFTLLDFNFLNDFGDHAAVTRLMMRPAFPLESSFNSNATRGRSFQNMSTSFLNTTVNNICEEYWKFHIDRMKIDILMLLWNRNRSSKAPWPSMG